MLMKMEKPIINLMYTEDCNPSIDKARKYQQETFLKRELKKYGWEKYIVSKKVAGREKVTPGIVYFNKTLKRTVVIADDRREKGTWKVAWGIEKNRFKVKNFLTKEDAERFAKNIIIGMNMGIE